MFSSHSVPIPTFIELFYAFPNILSKSSAADLLYVGKGTRIITRVEKKNCLRMHAKDPSVKSFTEVFAANNIFSIT